jgi:hypothetical protein
MVHSNKATTGQNEPLVDGRFAVLNSASEPRYRIYRAAFSTALDQLAFAPLACGDLAGKLA